MSLQVNHKQQKHSKRSARKIVALTVATTMLALTLAGCGSDNSRPSQANAVLPSSSSDATATPPFPAKGTNPTPTATNDVPVAIDKSPVPALFPTRTPLPNRQVPDFTATAGVPPLNLTPTAFPTGQLAYVQAGNLWLIDDTGGNRRQITSSSDIAVDSFMSWNNSRDRLVYISRSGDLYTVDLQGKRTLIFSPGRTAKLAGSVKLPPPPTPPSAGDGVATRAAASGSGLRLGETVWSMDGRYVAFTYYSGDSGPLASGEVWMAEFVGDKVNVVRVGEGFSPSWSPDGRTLAFLSRGEVKQGAPRPSPLLTPQGTPLLPPTKAGSSERNALQNAGTPSPTSFIIQPGGTIVPGNQTPQPGQTPAPTPSPTPTLNIAAFPSPTPTPTFPPVYLGSYAMNKIMLYTVSSRKTSVLMESDKLPDAFRDSSNLLRSYIPVPLQNIWFSPDGRYIAFADHLSVVGVTAVAGGNPVIWNGDPQGFAVFDLQWLPRSDGAFILSGHPYYDTGLKLELFTFNGNGAVTGVSGDVTNRDNLKVEQLPGTNISCEELSPGGNYFSYYDGRAVVITRTDGSIVSTYTDSECPAWSPFGTGFALIHKNSDRSINLATLGQPQQRTLISARAVDRVFWLRSDPSYLGGQPGIPPVANPLTPGR
ncbi:MAG TPA: hypothetical protein VH186_05765 [Chloroflexia bacterium]|nr:hypothetical protein [Chloroflexia bacterium]